MLQREHAKTPKWTETFNQFLIKSYYDIIKWNNDNTNISGVCKRNTRVTSDNRVMTNGRSVSEGGLKWASCSQRRGGDTQQPLWHVWPLTCELIIWRGVQDAETRSENTETLRVHHIREALIIIIIITIQISFCFYRRFTFIYEISPRALLVLF